MAIFSAKQFYLYSFNQDYLSSLYKDILHSALVYSRSLSIVDPKSGSVQNSFVDCIEKGNNMCYLYFSAFRQIPVLSYLNGMMSLDLSVNSKGWSPVNVS